MPPPQVFLSALLVGLMYSSMAIGLSLVWGVMKIINFAHGDFMVLASYIAWLFYSLHFDPYSSILVSAPGLFAVGVAVALLLTPLQRRNLPVGEIENLSVIVTFALASFLQNLMLYVFSPDVRFVASSFALENIDLRFATIPVAQLIASVGSLISAVLVYVLLNKTYLGLAIRSVADDIRAASLMGINTTNVWFLTFGIGFSLVGVAGTLFSVVFPFDPYSGLSYTIFSFLIIVLGGFGSMSGLLLSGLIFSFSQSIVAFYLGSEVGSAAAMSLVVALLLYTRGGIRGAQQ